MAEDTTASVIPLHQVPPKKKARTSAQRGKPRQPRKPRKPKAAAPPPDDDAPASETLIPTEFLPTDLVAAEPIVAPPQPAMVQALEPISKPSRPSPRRQLFAPVLLSIAALALAGVGITMNGWFARSLGSSDVAGWLFLAVGVAADVVALVMPACAAGLWHAGHRATALVGWAVWVMTFVFALTAGIGFASTNISDTTLARGSRTTPAVAVAQAALGDAMAARDRECKGGVGKFCREREAAVAERRQAVDTAMHTVEQTADPQTDAAIRVVAWVSRGVLQPTSNDFAMLRLVLLALLPQIGGILLLVGRRA
ncbi:MAG: hypothetical protein JOZ76_01925 [Bradyrhizobium sp.]|nr:hypothetical protein [Bradyrhizobium sp.]MBV9982490.1 hypothetical protein [Bradyrhizobium sp.]